MRPILYFPSEVHNRDWDARLLMADIAVARGFSAVIGQQWSLYANADVLPQGLLLVKTLNQIQVNVMNYFRSRGHMVAAMDEECFAIACDQDFLGFVSPGVGDGCDVFYANNPLHATSMAARVPALADKAVALGNARLDLLVRNGRERFRPDAEAIRGQFGPFILFNSNMAQSNSVWASFEEYMQIQVNAGALDPNDPESLATFKAQFTFEAANASAFEATIRWCIDNVPSHRIVIRPHPVERREYWENFAGGNPRIHIALNTHHVPWIMAADVLVHTNSTTGLEAAVLQKPTVNLMPDPEGHWSKIYVTSRINPTFLNWEDAARAIDLFVKTGEGPLVDDPRIAEELLRYFPSLESGFAGERMVDHMIGLMANHGLDASPFSFREIGDQYRPIHRPDVLLGKFSKTLADAVEDLRAIRRITRNRTEVRLTQIDESLFLYEPAR